MTQSRSPLEYEKPVPASKVGGTFFDAVTLTVIAFEYWIISYGILYGWGLGAGGAVCMLFGAILIIALLIVIRWREKRAKTLLQKINLGAAIALFVITAILFVMPAFGLPPWKGLL